MKQLKRTNKSEFSDLILKRIYIEPEEDDAIKFKEMAKFKPNSRLSK
jgi:hypothetical protein